MTLSNKIDLRKIPELQDINPRTWLRPFQKNSVPYLIKMAIFYQTLGIGLLNLGSFVASSVISDYSPPQIPVSVLLAIAAGPFEEAIFFGIPFYLTSNPYVVLASASVWSFAHIFSTNVISLSGLSYASFLFTIPHVFFGLRAWTSGKGWFAIIFHSVWNVSILLSYCAIGIRTCSIIGSGNELITDVLTLSAAATSTLFVYQIYKARTQKINRSLTILIVAGLGILIGLLSFFNFRFLF